MIIDVSKLFTSDGLSIQIENEFVPDNELFEYQDIVFNTPVALNGDIKSISSVLYLTLNISVAYTTKCSRCLKDTEAKLNFTINEIFSKSQLENKNDDVIILDSNEIDLKEIVEHSLSCELPITSLCSDDCKGLCPVCGCDLNVSSCSCETDDIDPRLAVLKDFFK